MSIAENKMVLDPQPAHVVLDLNSVILVRPTVVVHKLDGSVDTARTALGTPIEITLNQLKTLLGVV